MAKKNLTNPSHVLIFVEGDTDEVFFKAHRTYKKGYETKELINALDMSVIRNKRQDVLAPLEKTLGVVLL